MDDLLVPHSCNSSCCLPWLDYVQPELGLVMQTVSRSLRDDFPRSELATRRGNDDGAKRARTTLGRYFF
ncbi:hypothetical protein Tco_0928894 [Tanacetum coccineum]